MKTIQLTLVLFLSFTLVGNAQKNMTKSANKALGILLSDYSKTSSLKTVDTKKFIMYLSKKNHSTEGMKIKKVKELTYITTQKEERTIYLIQKIDEMSFNGPVCNFNSDLFPSEFENQCDTSGDDCEIIMDECDVEGDCVVFCIISNSCDPSGQSYPDCCNDASCDDDGGGGNSFRGNLSNPLEILMG